MELDRLFIHFILILLLIISHTGNNICCFSFGGMTTAIVFIIVAFLVIFLIYSAQLALNKILQFGADTLNYFAEKLDSKEK